MTKTIMELRLSDMNKMKQKIKGDTLSGRWRHHAISAHITKCDFKKPLHSDKLNNSISFVFVLSVSELKIQFLAEFSIMYCRSTGYNISSEVTVLCALFNIKMLSFSTKLKCSFAFTSVPG